MAAATKVDYYEVRGAKRGASAADNGYLKASEFKTYEARVASGIKLLNGFVRYLQKRKDAATKAG